MDLKEYYHDLGLEKQKLDRSYPTGEVFVTSQFNRDKNSRPGITVSANTYNAARVIVDGTHKLATKAEVQKFLESQEKNRVAAVRSEQLKKQQYVVVVDPNQPTAAVGSNGLQAAAQAASARSAAKAEAAVADVSADDSEDDDEDSDESDE